MKRIDIHHHIIPPKYVEILKEMGIAGSTGIKFPKWDATSNLKKLKKHGIDKAFLSISAPGIYFGNLDQTVQLARICNKSIAEAITTHPEHYGGFGTLPLPDEEASIKELDYIFDELKLDGVCLLSNYDGKYLGQMELNKLFTELNRRKATVFIHPNDHLIHEGIYKVITPIFERCQDTVRAVYNLLYNGYLDKYKDIRYIVSHGGGGLPYLADSIVEEYGKEQGMDLLKNIYFDTAQKGEVILNSLKSFVGSRKIVYGSDIPYTPDIELGMINKELDAYKGFTESEKNSIYSRGVSNE